MGISENKHVVHTFLDARGDLQTCYDQFRVVLIIAPSCLGSLPRVTARPRPGVQRIEVVLNK
jgi:hypothetical protein